MSKEKVQYAKVDRINDKERKGNHSKYVGKIGEVLKVQNDYLCFSDVLLRFNDGCRLWFNNTELIECDANGITTLIEQDKHHKHDEQVEDFRAWLEDEISKPGSNSDDIECIPDFLDLLPEFCKKWTVEQLWSAIRDR